MATVKFVGELGTTVHGQQKLKPGDILEVTDACAEDLIQRSDFELPKPEPKPKKKKKTGSKTTPADVPTPFDEE